MTQPALLTPAETCARLNISARQLQNLRFRRVGPPFTKIGALVRYPADELQRWIESRMQRPESPQ